MKNRKKRIDLIIELIRNQSIGSQEELASSLAKKGHPVTQATLSRDLKMLRTTKVPTDRGTYMYVLPDSDSLKDKIKSNGKTPAHSNYQSGFISIRFSGNIAVIKTRNGYASGLAYDIDMSMNNDILGTIPGSDTIFAVLREGMSRQEAIKLFSNILSVDPQDLTS